MLRSAEIEMTRQGAELRWEDELMGYMVVRGADGFFLYGPWTSAHHPRQAEMLQRLAEEEDLIVELEGQIGWLRLVLRRPPEDGEIELIMHPAVR